VELETDVTKLTRRSGGSGFILETSRGMFETREIVVAGGPFQVPNIPAAGSGLDPSIRQVHSHHYRNPDELTPGGVLVVGSGQSGVQLAEELQEAGRTVVLSVSHCGRLPRRYRGSDSLVWIHRIAVEGVRVGVPLPSVRDLPDPRARFACTAHVSGHHGGHDTNLRQMALDGIRLVGRFEGATGTRVAFGADLQAHNSDPIRFLWSFYAHHWDPLFGNAPTHLRIMCGMDMVFFGTFHALAAYTLIRGKRWLWPIPVALYAGAITYSVVLYFLDEFALGLPGTNFVMVIVLNAAYGLVPWAHLWYLGKTSPNQ
jgi:hypothetical protein